ncbi:MULTISPECIES: ATP-binding protein [unclassified Microcoleus]|uniref:nSTAND1 domain-containing NTPase n=1 Tax=unclassified Microcoleus TaxID=2642155 RepID=UPI0025E62513|nr:MULTISPECIES: ATP-binding protein [unclassified Microcoleus]
MPPQSIKASKAGIEKAEMVRIDKGWSRQDIADRVVTGEGKSELKGISLQTVKTFFRCNGVTTQNFVGICKALGLDWQEIKESNTTTHGGPETGFFSRKDPLQPVDSVKNPVSSIAVDDSDRNNPFIPQHGKIDDPRFFFGREREMRRVFETLNSGSSVAIIGERAIGKSSLLQAIYREAPTQLRYPRKPIYIDLQIVCNENDFHADLCYQAGIPKANGFDLSRALESNPLLLLLDEVENMTWDGFTNPIRSFLRGSTEGSNPPLRLVVAAETSLDILFPGKNMTSPFKGHEETLKQWDDQISREFIASRLQADWLTPVDKPVNFTEAEIAGLIAESGGYPQKLMQLCYKTYAGYINDAKSP